jgi:beta-galactosidase
VPRLGWLLALEQPDAADVAVEWVGQGPGESYADSTTAVLFGRYQHTVAELQTPYTHPQENGARRGVTRARLELEGGPLELRAGDVILGADDLEGFELTARPWSDQALAAAAHPHELTPDGALWLHVDIAQHGVGSAACGPGVLPNATLNPAPASMQVRLRVG